jgi:DNA-binding GntR family transcriptional regulator
VLVVPFRAKRQEQSKQRLAVGQVDAEHFEMIDCVEKRDGPGAAAVTRRDLERARGVWLQQNGTGAGVEPSR